MIRSLAEALPEFDVETSHSIHISAAPVKAYEVARKLDFSSSKVVRILFALRCMPAAGLSVSGLEKIGFKVLHDDPGRGFVVGLIGQFWTMRGGLRDFAPDEFQQIHLPGYAKAIWSFEAADDSEGTILTTTTRVHCQDAESLRRFRRYWRVIGPFSGVIRQVALRIVKENAEAAA